MANYTSLQWTKIRILVISLCFVVGLGLILLRSYYLQIAEDSRIHHLAQKQYNKTLPIYPKRGTIYDRNGEVLAMDVEVASIAMHPYLIENKPEVVKNLSLILSIPEKEIKQKLESRKKFLWLARRIPWEKGILVGKQNFSGVTVIPEYRRYYPNRELAGNLLGAVGYDAKALGGLELKLDNFLKSQSKKWVGEKDAKGRIYSPVLAEGPTFDVYLTLDLNIQYMVEKYLWMGAKENKAKSGFAIVMDPQTGEVLAMANYPSFNPNSYWEYSLDKWKNHAVIDSFEPGSTFKGILAAAALSTGQFKSNDTFDCENGVMQIGKHKIRDHEPYQKLKFSEVIQHSSNIGATKISKKMGKEPYYIMIRKLGFGEKTALELPGEETGFLAHYSQWKPIDQSNISFGQGIAVTGIQLASAYATLANQGVRMKPFLISKIINSRGKIVSENYPEAKEQVLDQTSSRELTKILWGVVGDHGTGRLASVPGYEVAGKTGTAQKVNPLTKTYDEKNYIGSFIGYLPASHPKFLIYVVYDSPQGVHTGGMIAAPVFSQIARELLSYSGVATSSAEGEHYAQSH